MDRIIRWLCSLLVQKPIARRAAAVLVVGAPTVRVAVARVPARANEAAVDIGD